MSELAIVVCITVATFLIVSAIARSRERDRAARMWELRSIRNMRRVIRDRFERPAELFNEDGQSAFSQPSDRRGFPAAVTGLIQHKSGGTMGEQLSPESRRLSEMVERIKAKWETELPQKIARMKKAEALAKAASEEATWWQEEIAKARAHGPSPEYLKKTEEYAKREWKQSTKEQLKTAWNQIKRSSRFGLLLYMGYLARADLGPLQMVFLAFLAFCFLSWEYQERKELIAETELTMNEQTSRRLAPLEEKQAGLEQLIEETIFILAAVERKTRGATT